MVNYDVSILTGASNLSRYDAMDLVYSTGEALVELVMHFQSPDGEILSNAFRIALHLLYQTSEEELSNQNVEEPSGQDIKEPSHQDVGEQILHDSKRRSKHKRASPPANRGETPLYIRSLI